MIVVHGKSEITSTGGGESFSLTIDNGDPKIKKDTRKPATVVPSHIAAMATFDSSDISAEVVVVIKGTIKGVQNASIEEAKANGARYTIKTPSSDVEGMPKEYYLKEMSAFSAAVADPRRGFASINSPLSGPITCETVKEETEKVCTDILHFKQEGENFTITFDATALLGKFINGVDYAIVDSLSIKFKGTMESDGSVASAEAEYTHQSGAPITNGVSGLDSESINFVTLDSNIHMVSGWLDGAEITYQRRTIASTRGSMYHAMFTYLFFSQVSPLYFKKDLQSVALCAKQKNGLYIMPWVITNAASFKGDPVAVSATGRGPSYEGSISVSATEDTISFNTSAAKTSSGRVIADLTIGGSPFSKHPLEMPCGIGTGKFKTAAVDCKIAYNTLSNLDERGRTHEAMAAGLHTFHHMINGLEDCLSITNLASMIMNRLLGIVTRGISCLITSNTLEFVFYLMYERDKLILSSAERDIMIGGINAVFDRHNAALSEATTGVPKKFRKNMSSQFLETIQDWRFRQRRSLGGSGFFIWNIFCVNVMFTFPRSMPWQPKAPDYGVPLKAEILVDASRANGLLTDDIKSMMKKNLAFNIWETRADWMLNYTLKEGIKHSATSWTQLGKTLVLKRDGRHQELYSISDAGYRIGDYKKKGHEPAKVSIDGEVGKLWNKWKEAVINCNSNPHYSNWLEGPYGSSAESFMENLGVKNDVVMIWSRFNVIDLDNEVLIEEGESVDVKFIRPNSNVLIVVGG
jgi:hypothetical protein